MAHPARRRDRIVTATLLGTVGLFAVGLGRVAQLEIAPASELVQHVGRRTRTSSDLAFRGPIVDRRGRVLAQTVLGHDLAVDVKVLCDQAVEMSDDPAADPRPALAAALAFVQPFTDADASASAGNLLGWVLAGVAGSAALCGVLAVADVTAFRNRGVRPVPVWWVVALGALAPVPTRLHFLRSDVL
jgi:hypothetical protein